MSIYTIPWKNITAYITHKEHSYIHQAMSEVAFGASAEEVSEFLSFFAPLLTSCTFAVTSGGTLRVPPLPSLRKFRIYRASAAVAISVSSQDVADLVTAGRDQLEVLDLVAVNISYFNISDFHATILDCAPSLASTLTFFRLPLRRMTALGKLLLRLSLATVFFRASENFVVAASGACEADKFLTTNFQLSLVPETVDELLACEFPDAYEDLIDEFDGEEEISDLQRLVLRRRVYAAVVGEKKETRSSFGSTLSRTSENSGFSTPYRREAAALP